MMLHSYLVKAAMSSVTNETPANAIFRVTKPLRNIMIKNIAIGSFIALVFVIVVTCYIVKDHNIDPAGDKIGHTVITVMAISFMPVVMAIVTIIFTFIGKRGGIIINSKISQNINELLKKKVLSSITPVAWEAFVIFIKSIIDANFNANKSVVLVTIAVVFCVTISVVNLIMSIKKDQAWKGINSIRLIFFIVGLCLLTVGIIMLFTANKNIYQIQKYLDRIALINNGYINNSHKAAQYGALSTLINCITEEFMEIKKKANKTFDWHSVMTSVIIFFALCSLICAFNDGFGWRYEIKPGHSDYNAEDEESNHKELKYLPNQNFLPAIFGCLSIVMIQVFLSQAFINTGMAIEKNLMELEKMLKDKHPGGNTRFKPTTKFDIFVNIENPFTGSKLRTTFVGEGYLTFIAGGNGAGKSTTAKIIMGELGHQKRQVVFEPHNKELEPIDASELAHGEIGQRIHFQEQGSRFDHLTLLQVLACHGISNPADQAALVAQINHMLARVFPGENRFEFSGHSILGDMHTSGGENQIILNIIAILVAINKGAGWLVLDEITQNLSPHMSRHFMKLIGELALQYGIHIIIISHDNIKRLHKEKLFPAALPMRIIRMRRRKSAKISIIQGNTGKA